jgi:Cu+-exporting ATPase
MIRRNFIQWISGLAAAGAAGASQSRTVTFHVTGFSCITCAVGLDTLLRRQKGVVRSDSSYPNASATIEYNPDLVTEETIKRLIGEMGFGAER